MNPYSAAKARLAQAALQIKACRRDTLCGGMAAGLSWFVSQSVFGHERPLFASMAALVCLSPGLANHGKQALYLLAGVTTGVLVGEFALLFPPVPTPIRIGLVAFVASLLACSYAIVPVLIIQSGMAAVMVFAMGPQVAGFARLSDVLLGAGIGLVFSQILFTPNPLKSLRISAKLFFHDMGSLLDSAAAALERRSLKQASQALQNCNKAHNALIAVAGNATAAQESTFWSVRGLMKSRHTVRAQAAQYNRVAIRLYAASLLLCESLCSGLKKTQTEPPPAWFVESLRNSARNCRFLAGEDKTGSFIRQNRSARAAPPLCWADSAKSLEMVENALARLYKSTSRAERLRLSRQRLSALIAERAKAPWRGKARKGKAQTRKAA